MVFWHFVFSIVSGKCQLSLVIIEKEELYIAYPGPVQDLLCHVDSIIDKKIQDIEKLKKSMTVFINLLKPFIEASQ